MRAENVPKLVRWLSSMSMKMSVERSWYFLTARALSNLWIRVVTIPAFFSATSSSSAARWPAGVEATGGEGVLHLLVEIVAVGDQHDARVGDVAFQRQIAGQHHHGQRLARALGVPDDPALPPPVAIELFDPFQGALNDKILLVAGDLLDAAVEDGELEGQLQQPLRPAEAVERPVLFGDQPSPSASRASKNSRAGANSPLNRASCCSSVSGG